MPLPRCPVVYQVNTIAWLSELSRREGRPVTLATVPGADWDGVTGPGIHAVWLMGVWERSPAGLTIALANPGLRDELRRALPDLAARDVPASPYCIRRYVVDLYDHLVRGDTPAVRAHLRAERAHQDALVRFIENHDEQRAAAVLGAARSRAAAALVAALPGALLVYQGQLDGRTVRIPVFLTRWPDEVAGAGAPAVVRSGRSRVAPERYAERGLLRSRRRRAVT
jgi:hypothetical protein